MASWVTHLVVGERVFARLQQFGEQEYGAFLLGCVLVDLHAFSDIDRRTTHFVGRLEEDGVEAFTKSCANFLSQLDDVLRRPWGKLVSTERAFVAGYLCHLAVDEDWKRFGWDILRAAGLKSLADYPVPGEVFLTAFDVLSSELYVDFPAIALVLETASIPDVLAHVPYDTLQTMWAITKEYVMDGKTAESYFELLERAGKTDAEVQAVRDAHDVYLEDAVTAIHDLGGVEPRIQAAVERSLEMAPRLWAQDHPAIAHNTECMLIL
jgi:hypothetical protein